MNNFMHIPNYFNYTDLEFCHCHWTHGGGIHLHWNLHWKSVKQSRQLRNIPIGATGMLWIDHIAPSSHFLSAKFTISFCYAVNEGNPLARIIVKLLNNFSTVKVAREQPFETNSKLKIIIQESYLLQATLFQREKKVKIKLNSVAWVSERTIPTKR
jgi:hypothetical protein